MHPVTSVTSHEKFSIADNDNIICNIDFEAIGESMGKFPGTLLLLIES